MISASPAPITLGPGDRRYAAEAVGGISKAQSVLAQTRTGKNEAPCFGLPRAQIKTSKMSGTGESTETMGPTVDTVPAPEATSETTGDHSRQCCVCKDWHDGYDSVTGQNDCEQCDRFYCPACEDSSCFPFPQAGWKTREEYWDEEGGDGSDLLCHRCIFAVQANVTGGSWRDCCRTAGGVAKAQPGQHEDAQQKKMKAPDLADLGQQIKTSTMSVTKAQIAEMDTALARHDARRGVVKPEGWTANTVDHQPVRPSVWHRADTTTDDWERVEETNWDGTGDDLASFALDVTTCGGEVFFCVGCDKPTQGEFSPTDDGTCGDCCRTCAFEELEGNTVPALKQMLGERGLIKSGKKQDLINRILQFNASE